ncbi:MAG: hypothetical protein HY402_00205, partial [Elusimicrobia bacterium]|nr:hypothetical protein [Elusimicrobiota bacterium]
MKKHDQQDESAGIAGEKRPWRDFLRGSALQAVFLVLYLHIPLFTTGVWVFDPMRIDPQQGLAGVGEPNYQIIPAFYIASRSLKNGFLPTWSPFAGGGIPFIARQHSCIFSPSRLPFFILPEKIFPYLWLPTLFLWLYLAWACVYLLARAWDLPHWLCVFAGSVYSMSFLILPLRLYPSAEASVLAPAMILLADTYLNTRSRKALLLLPWVVLHPLLAGHFETAFRMYFATGAFFLLRLWKEQKYTLKESLRMIFHFTASAAAGLLIGFFQIASAMEYLHHSYINVWRNLPQFAFYLHNLSKKLSA